MEDRMLKKLGIAVCLATTLSLSAHAADKAKLDERVSAANDVLHELQNTPDKGIPNSVASKATCVIVIPGFKKGAFIVGAERGNGVATCRTGNGWSGPAFVQLTGASFGAQIGGQSTDLVLIATSHDAAEHLLKDKVKLGGDVGIAAGPVGREGQASTTDTANAGFLSYSRSKGIFAGVDLSGDVVNQKQDDTNAYYGKDTTFESVLHGQVRAPASASAFEQTVAQVFGHHGNTAAGE
jgi:lipid-binding SYLF domain-containing protein